MTDAGGIYVRIHNSFELCLLNGDDLFGDHCEFGARIHLSTQAHRPRQAHCNVMAWHGIKARAIGAMNTPTADTNLSFRYHRRRHCCRCLFRISIET